MKERVLLITLLSLILTALIVYIHPLHISMVGMIVTFYITLLITSLLYFGSLRTNNANDA